MKRGEKRGWQRLQAALTCATLALNLCACAWTGRPSQPETQVRVKVIAFNDFHGYLEPPGTRLVVPDPDRPGVTLTVPTGGAAELATLVQRVRNENPNHIVVGAGDMVGASPLTSGLFLDEPTIEVLDAIGLELTSVGNHEFDRGVAELLRKQYGGCESDTTMIPCQTGHAFQGAHFHYLAANVIDTRTGKPVLPAYEIRRFEGQPIAFIGMTLQGTSRIVAPTGIEHIEFRDEASTANALVDQLRKQGVRSFVLLIHQGGETQPDRIGDPCDHFEGEILPILDRLDPDISVVISGHTHQAYICNYRGFLVTSAASFSRLLTDIDLTIDPASGKVIAKSAENRVVAGPNDPTSAAGRAYPPLDPDPAIAAQVHYFAERARPLAERPVGRIAAALTRSGPNQFESTLGDVIADAQWQETRASAGAQMALTNPGGIRTDLGFVADGVVSYGAVFAAQPFGNSLVTMTLTGAQIKAVLEQQWSAHPQHALFLQVSDSFRYTFDIRRPVGDRVVPASLSIDGVPLAPERRYRVTVNSYLAAGGDGFSELTKGDQAVVGMLDADALESYLRQNSPLAPPITHRISARTDP